MDTFNNLTNSSGPLCWISFEIPVVSLSEKVRGLTGPASDHSKQQSMFEPSPDLESLDGAETACVAFCLCLCTSAQVNRAQHACAHAHLEAPVAGSSAQQEEAGAA